MKRRSFLRLCAALPFLPQLFKIELPRPELLTQPGGRVWFLDAKHGDDTKDGLTPETALKSYGEMFNRISKSSEVHVMPGDYGEGEK